MGSRARSLGRWALGTFLFGSAFLLVDISLYHFLRLRRPRAATAEWHLHIALAAGVAGLLAGALGAWLVRRWTRSPSSRDEAARPDHR